MYVLLSSSRGRGKKNLVFISLLLHFFLLRAVLVKGQVSTSPYRFLASGGGFVWAETQATVLYNNKTSHAEAVVCLNFVLRYAIDQRWAINFPNYPTVSDVEDRAMLTSIVFNVK